MGRASPNFPLFSELERSPSDELTILLPRLDLQASKLSDDRPACQDEACAIQSCLSRTSYNEQKCQQYVTALYRCCATFYDQAAAGSYKNLGGADRQDVKKSTACPLESIVRRTIKQMDAEAAGEQSK